MLVPSEVLESAVDRDVNVRIHEPGVTNLPVPSMTRLPLGTLTLARGPTAAIRFPRMTIVASCTGGVPVPSITVAPTMAIGVCA